MFRTIVAKVPENVSIASAYVERLSKVSEASEARRVLEALPEIADESAERLAIATQLAYLECDFERARELATRWFRADPSSERAAALSIMLSGQLTEDWAAAAKLAMQATRLIQGSSWLNNDAAYVLALGGRPREALALLEAAAGREYVTMATRGLALVASGQVRRGLAMYRRAAEVADAETVDAHGRSLMTMHQAMALKRLGLDPETIAEVRAASLPAVELPADWHDVPGFRLLAHVAEGRGWSWPVVIA